jgi:hypothetical protein
MAWLKDEPSSEMFPRFDDFLQDHSTAEASGRSLTGGAR